MFKRVLIVHLESLPGEPVIFQARRLYKTQARCEVAAARECARVAPMLRRRLGHYRFKLETKAVAA